MNTRVLIVGSGIAGQVLACALARRAIECDLVELKPAFDVIGAGMYMQSNALRALADIDVVPEIVRAGFPVSGDYSQVADAQGNVLARPSYPRIAGPEVPSVVPIQRKALHAVLASAVTRNGIAPRMGLTVDELSEDPAREGLRVRFSDGSETEYDLVVGADGIRSRIRSLLFPGVEPAFSGFSNWRVVLPRPAEIDRPFWLIGTGRSIGVIPIAQELVYMAGVSKEPGNPRYPAEALPGLYREKFAAFGGPIPGLLAQVREPAQVVYTPIEEVHLPAPWYRGRTVVIGDAAHAGTPFWAQGASMAIEDAVLLARLLEEHRNRPDAKAIDRVLAHWMARRIDRCRFVQQGSLDTGQRSHSEAPGALESLQAYARTRLVADVARRYERLAEDFC